MFFAWDTLAICLGHFLKVLGQAVVTGLAYVWDIRGRVWGSFASFLCELCKVFGSK